MKPFWCVPVAVMASSCVLVSRLFPKDPPSFMARSATPVEGMEAMVAGIAIQDYIRAQVAETEGAGWLAPDGGVLPANPDAGWTQSIVEFHRCVNSPSSYTVWLEVDAGPRPLWHVVIWPSGACLRDAFGGGGEYQVDGESFEVLHREFYE